MALRGAANCVLALLALVSTAQAQESVADFYRGKLAACAYFFRWELPKTGPQLDLLDSLDATCVEVEPSWL